MARAGHAPPTAGRMSASTAPVRPIRLTLGPRGPISSPWASAWS